MVGYNKNSSASALPRIKVKSGLSGLPPQCPGRVRCHLEVTVGPVEWNPLHAMHQPDDKMTLSLVWWGDESSTELPISTTRETFTYFKVTRSLKTLQCYLTDMGSLTLNLQDKYGNPIGAASVPGIKRLSKDNQIREITNIRDGNEGYRLGRLPVTINLAEPRRLRSRSSSRSGSRSNSVKRSRSNSARRSRSNSSSRRKNRSDQSPTNQQKEYSAPKKILKNRNPSNQQQFDLRPVPSLDPIEITSKIDDLLQKSNQLQAQMNNLQTHSQSAVTISSEKSDIGTLNIPKLNLEAIRQSSSPEKENFEKEKTIYATTKNSYSTLTKNRISNMKFNAPQNLGRARELPQLKLNIPSLPTETPRYTSSTTPKTINDYQNNPRFMNPSAQGLANLEPAYMPHKISDKESPQVHRDFNELILNQSLRSNQTVDYVPSEADSLLDEEILESIYRVNGPMGGQNAYMTHGDMSHIGQGDEIKEEKIDYWLKKGDSLCIKVIDLELPRRKGRPPPISKSRIIDDSYFLEFTMPWVKSDSKRDQIEKCRFQSRRMKNGKIIFEDERIFEAKENVKDNIIISLYYKTKFKSKWEKIDSLRLDEIDDHEIITAKFNNTHLAQIILSRIVNEELENHECEIISIPTLSAGRLENSKKEIESSVDHVTRQEMTDPITQSKVQGSSVEFVNVVQPTVDISRNQGRPYHKSSGFQASFPISFLLVVKGAHGLPHIRENHFATPTSPLVHLSIRSCVLDEGQITIRTSERSNNPNFDSYYEWNTSIDEDKVDLLQSSFFALELWCSTNESDDQLLGLGRVSTAGLSSILVGGYSLLCSPRYPVIMADGRIPLRELVTNQNRGQLEILIAAGTSIQLENLKSKRSDISQILALDDEKSNTLIAQSLQNSEDILEDEPEHEEIPKLPEEALDQSQLEHPPSGISCLISIERCSNLNIRQSSKVQVRLDTEEGTVSTNWTSSGNFGFQKNCLLADPLPGKLIFNIFLRYSQSQNHSSNSDFQNSETLEYERELGWIEMSLFTLGFGFPQINGWYSVTSISGDTIGQIKLGLAPSIQTPRTFTRRVQPEKSISLQSNLATLQPEKLEQSNKNLHTQLQELDDLVKTVKARQFELDENRKEICEFGTQVTPSLSRIETDRNVQPAIVQSESSIPSSSIRHIPPVAAGIGSFVGQSGFSQSEDEESDEDQSENDLDELEENLEVVETNLLNSDAKIDELSSRTSSKSNILSSTRIESDPEDQEEKTLDPEDKTLESTNQNSENDNQSENDSEANLKKMMEDFSSSCRSAENNLQNYKKFQTSIREDFPEGQLHETANETSVWSEGHEDTIEDTVEDETVAVKISPENFQTGGEVVLSVGDLLDQDESSDSSACGTSENVIHVPGSPSSPRTPRTETMQTTAQSPYSESDSINVDALMSGDIEEDQFKNNLKGTAKLALESTDYDDDVIVQTDGDLERPNRSKGTLNPTQTKRLAAIFGIQ